MKQSESPTIFMTSNDGYKYRGNSYKIQIFLLATF